MCIRDREVHAVLEVALPGGRSKWRERERAPLTRRHVLTKGHREVAAGRSLLLPRIDAALIRGDLVVRQRGTHPVACEGGSLRVIDLERGVAGVREGAGDDDPQAWRDVERLEPVLGRSVRKTSIRRGRRGYVRGDVPGARQRGGRRGGCRHRRCARCGRRGGCDRRSSCRWRAPRYEREHPQSERSVAYTQPQPAWGGRPATKPGCPGARFTPYMGRPTLRVLGGLEPAPNRHRVERNDDARRQIAIRQVPATVAGCDIAGPFRLLQSPHLVARLTMPGRLWRAAGRHSAVIDRPPPVRRCR